MGQLHIIKQGVLEMEVEKQKMICPASYAIWTPANKVHQAFNRNDLEYCAINVSTNLCKKAAKGSLHDSAYTIVK